MRFMMKHISIIVPVYNAEKYLKKCIDSILKQSFESFELLLINDGSTDSSGDICEQYKNQDDRIRVIHQKNQGQAVARNYGVKQSKTDWICFVDADDILHPNYLEKLYVGISDVNVGMSMCNAIESSKLPDNFFEDIAEKESQIEQVNDLYLEKLYNSGKHSYWTLWGKLICKDIILKNPIPEHQIYEDNAIVFEWIIDSKKVSYLDEELYFYYVNMTGTTKSGFQLKNLDYLKALNRQYNYYLNHEKYPIMKKIIGQRFFEDMLYMYNLLTENQHKNPKRKIRRYLLRFIQKNRKEIELNYNQIRYAISLLYPRMYMILRGVKKIGKKIGESR